MRSHFKKEGTRARVLNPLRAAQGARALAAREVDGGRYPRGEEPGTRGEHGADGGGARGGRGSCPEVPRVPPPRSPPAPLPHEPSLPPPLGPAARSALRSARLTGLTRRRSVPPCCPRGSTIRPPTSPAPRRHLTCPSAVAAADTPASRPPGPGPATPPASRPNADTKPALIGHARHVGRGIHRRQFQTAEQTESPRRDPTPARAWDTLLPPRRDPGIPPAAGGRGPAAGPGRRRAARSRRCSEVVGGGLEARGRRARRAGSAGGWGDWLATVRRAVASTSRPPPHPPHLSH